MIWGYPNFRKYPYLLPNVFCLKKIKRCNNKKHHTFPAMLTPACLCSNHSRKTGVHFMSTMFSPNSGDVWPGFSPWIVQHAMPLKSFTTNQRAFFTGEVYVDGNQLKVGGLDLGQLVGDWWVWLMFQAPKNPPKPTLVFQFVTFL